MSSSLPHFAYVWIRPISQYRVFLYIEFSVLEPALCEPTHSTQGNSHQSQTAGAPQRPKRTIVICDDATIRRSNEVLIKRVPSGDVNYLYIYTHIYIYTIRFVLSCGKASFLFVYCFECVLCSSSVVMN